MHAYRALLYPAGLGASKAEATSTPSIAQQPPQVPPPDPTPQLDTAAVEVSGRGTKRQRAQLQLGSVHSQHHQRKEGSQQSEAAEQTSPLSSAPDSSAKHTKRLKTGSAVTGSGQHQQAVPGSRAPADIHKSKKGKLKTSQEAASAKAQQAGTPPQPAQLASPVRAVPDSPAQGRQRRKQGPPDAGAAKQQQQQSQTQDQKQNQKQKRKRSSQPSEAAAASQAEGQGPSAAAKESQGQPRASEPKARRRKTGAGSTADASPTSAARASAEGSKQKAGRTSSMPELPAGMTWEDSGKRTDVKKGRYCSPQLSHHSSCCLVLLLAQRCEPSCQALQCLLVQLHRRMPCNDGVGLRTMLLCRFSAQEKEGIERAVREYAAACDLPPDDLSWVIGVRKGVAPPVVCGRRCSRTPDS